jgi:hypothetical protein
MNYQPDRVDRYLMIWACWMRKYRLALGYPQHTPGIVTGGSVASWDDFESQCNNVAARAVDALIGDLCSHHRHAIEAAWLGHKWIYPDQALEYSYDAATHQIEKGLSRKGLP